MYPLEGKTVVTGRAGRCFEHTYCCSWFRDPRHKRIKGSHQGLAHRQRIEFDWWNCRTTYVQRAAARVVLLHKFTSFDGAGLFFWVQRHPRKLGTHPPPSRQLPPPGRIFLLLVLCRCTCGLTASMSRCWRRGARGVARKAVVRASSAVSMSIVASSAAPFAPLAAPSPPPASLVALKAMLPAVLVTLASLSASQVGFCGVAACRAVRRGTFSERSFRVLCLAPSKQALLLYGSSLTCCRPCFGGVCGRSSSVSLLSYADW